MTYRAMMTFVLVTLAGVLVSASAPSPAQSPTRAQTGTDKRPGQPRWDKVSVTFPVSTRLFPAADAAELANSQCLLCHSAEMVLSQPPRSEAQWKEIINKMRKVYGAPLPEEQVSALAAYFVGVVGGTGTRPEP